LGFYRTPSSNWDDDLYARIEGRVNLQGGITNASPSLFVADQRHTLRGKANYRWGLLQMSSNTLRRRRFPDADGLKSKEFFVLATFCAVIGVLPIRAAADETFSAKSALEDTKLYFTAPLRWDEEDWIAFGGALVAIGAAHQFDAKVRDHFATGSKAILNGGEDKDSLRDAAPAVALLAGTGLYAAFIRDSDGYRETWAAIHFHRSM
jgi:hypothetical protein